MRVKTSELTGAALDWAVASSEFDAGNICAKNIPPGHPYVLVFHENGDPRKGGTEFAPSTDWSQGGSIIEQELVALNVLFMNAPSLRWMASAQGGSMYPSCVQYGPTPLVAAMRCFVASKLGDEVGIPEELCK